MTRFLLAAILCWPLAVAAQAPAPQPLPKTAKERLGDKASDEQRVDDCKVPAARRTRPRPAACPWEAGS
jgi:hypothetical protein